MPGPLVLAPAAPLVPVAAGGSLMLPVLAGVSVVAAGSGAYVLIQTESGSKVLDAIGRMGQRAVRTAISEVVEMGGNTWTRWRGYRISELMKAEGMSRDEAEKRARQEYNALYKDGPYPEQLGGDGPPQSTLTGADGLHVANMSLNVPYKVDVEPDIAAAWDVAEGVLLYLQEQARGTTRGELVRRKASMAYRRARGGTQADDHENDMGKAVGEALVMVMVHYGVTPSDWAQMVPPDVIAASLAPANTNQAPGRAPGVDASDQLGGDVLSVFDEATGAESGSSSPLNEPPFSKQAGTEVGQAAGVIVQGVASGITQGILSFFDE